MKKFISSLKLEWIYLALMLFAGTVMTFLTPVYQIPDEPDHFARAWQISEQKFLSPVRDREDGYRDLLSDVPADFPQSDYTSDVFHAKDRFSLQDITEFFSSQFDTGKRTTHVINNTGSYAPVVYFPQALTAYLISNFTDGGVWVTSAKVFYFMRLAAALFSTLCVFFAIRFLPEKGFLIFLISLMPMFLAESASIAADSVINSVCIFVSAYILSLTLSEEELSFSQIITLIIMAVTIGLLKQVYGTIMLLYFLIPYKRLGSMRRYIIFGFILLSICLASALTWLYFGVARVNAASGFRTDLVINPAEQMKFLAANPVLVLKIIIKANLTRLKFYAESFIGILGWLTLRMPRWFYLLYAIMLVAGGLSGKIKIFWWQRLLIIAGCFATLFATDIMLYLTWNPPGAFDCAGLQGRYFIPLALTAFSALSCLPKLKYEKFVACIIGLISVFITIAKTYSYFYY